MPKFKLEEPISVASLLSLALEHPDACYDPERHLPKSELVQIYSRKLQAKADLFSDYFSIYFFGPEEQGGEEQGENNENEEECKLFALPLVLPAVRPFAQELPMFLLRLATEVDYNASEEKFIQQVADEISFYYARYVDLLTLQA